MTNEHAPITRNLAVSLAAHILIFGAAIVFTQYGGGPFRPDRSVVMVSLVSDGGGAAGGMVKRVRGMLSGPASVEGTDAAVSERASVLAPASVSASDGSDHQAPLQEQAYGGQGAVAPETAGGDAAAGQRFGYSSAQWQLLQASLERATTYPRLARERGIEGTVLVRFRSSPSGNIEQVDVVKSSGARILDEASVSTVYRAAPVPYVDGWVEVPMVYRLRKAGEE